MTGADLTPARLREIAELANKLPTLEQTNKALVLLDSIEADVDRLRAKVEAQQAVVEAARRIRDWDDSIEAEDCPTLREIARAALAALDDDAPYPSTHKMTLADEGNMEC